LIKPWKLKAVDNQLQQAQKAIHMGLLASCTLHQSLLGLNQPLFPRMTQLYPSQSTKKSAILYKQVAGHQEALSLRSPFFNPCRRVGFSATGYIIMETFRAQ
jgi:hypothetical protein